MVQCLRTVISSFLGQNFLLLTLYPKTSKCLIITRESESLLFHHFFGEEVRNYKIIPLKTLREFAAFSGCDYAPHVAQMGPKTLRSFFKSWCLTASNHDEILSVIELTKTWNSGSFLGDGKCQFYHRLFAETCDLFCYPCLQNYSVGERLTNRRRIYCRVNEP